MLLDGPAIAADLTKELDREIKASTVRQWASRRLIERRGRDAQGRTLYDYDEVLAIATRRTGEPADTAPCGTVTPGCSTTRVSGDR